MEFFGLQFCSLVAMVALFAAGPTPHFASGLTPAGSLFRKMVYDASEIVANQVCFSHTCIEEENAAKK